MKKLGKKGFTLVEIIVVVAIVGILAAILVPTLIGYTIKASVTSANSTAASLRKNVNSFLLEADVDNYGMKIAESSHTEIEVTVTNSVWNVTVGDPNVFVSIPGHVWAGSGTGTYGGSISAAACPEDEMAIYLANLYPEITTAYMKFNVKAGDCNALYYTDETDTPFTIQNFAVNGWAVSVYNWDNNNAGVCTEGYIVGTAPVLELG